MKAPSTNICFTEDIQFSLKSLDRIRRQQAFARANRSVFAKLSNRERQVLGLIAEGLSNETIGKQLFVSVHTIRTHRQNIRRQLGIHGVVEAVWWGQCFDLV